MSRILCVWELGDDLGHLAKWSAITNALNARGHEVYFSAKDFSRAGYFVFDKGVRCLQSPVWLPRPAQSLATQSFADILLNKGFATPNQLRPMVQAWMYLMDLVKPDLMLFDHAPTALLASRFFTVPRVVVSEPFTSLPPRHPVEHLRPWDKRADDKLEEQEHHLVAIINMIATQYQFTPIVHVSDLYDVDRVLLTGYAPLDMYRHHRRNAIYLGPFATRAHFQLPQWHDLNRKLFAYLKYGAEHVDTLLNVLSKMHVNALVYCAGASAEWCQARSTPRLQLTNKPVDINAVMAQASTVVCHGGMGVVNASLCAGIPLVILPLQLEQRHTANLLREQHLGIVIERQDRAADIEEKLDVFFCDQRYSEHAKQFAHAQAQLVPHNALEFLCEHCEGLLK